MYLAFEIALAVMVAAAIFMLTRSQRTHEEHWPFVPRPLMSGPEQLLFRRLIEALPECYVLAHVPLARLLDVKEGEADREWRNLIADKILDFAVCGQDSTIVAAVELSESSEKGLERRQADETRDKALVDAGIKLLRWSTSALPDGAAIKAAFAS